jgi:hypothetical protein
MTWRAKGKSGRPCIRDGQRRGTLLVLEPAASAAAVVLVVPVPAVVVVVAIGVGVVVVPAVVFHAQGRAA